MGWFLCGSEAGGWQRLPVEMPLCTGQMPCPCLMCKFRSLGCARGAAGTRERALCRSPCQKPTPGSKALCEGWAGLRGFSLALCPLAGCFLFLSALLWVQRESDCDGEALSVCTRPCLGHLTWTEMGSGSVTGAVTLAVSSSDREDVTCLF